MNEPTDGMRAAATKLLTDVLIRYDYNDQNRDIIVGEIHRHIGPELAAKDALIAELEARIEEVTISRNDWQHNSSKWERACAETEALVMSHEGRIEALHQQLVSVTAGRDNANERAEKAEAELLTSKADAAAMRASANTIIRCSLPPNDVSGQRMFLSACNVVRDGTAGQALLDELKRLREVILRVDSACIAVLQSHPEGPDNVEKLATMKIASYILSITREQQTSEVSK